MNEDPEKPGKGEVTFDELTVGQTYYIYEVDGEGVPVGDGYAYTVEGSGTSKTIERGVLNYTVNLTNRVTDCLTVSWNLMHIMYMSSLSLRKRKNLPSRRS